MHQILTLKYSIICVPPLPDKSYSGEYGEDQNVQRCKKLKAWVDRVLQHPILAKDKVALELFLLCDDERGGGGKDQWKRGKKEAEKDELVGKYFFLLAEPCLDYPKDAPIQIQRFKSFQVTMSKGVKSCSEIASAYSKRLAGAIRKDYTQISHGFQKLSDVFKETTNGDSIKMAMAIQQAADKLGEVAGICKDQPRHDQMPWVDRLTEYGSMLSQYKEAIDSSIQSESIVTQQEKQAEKINEAETPNAQEIFDDMDAVRERAELIHMMTLCEVSHFHTQRRRDFKRYFSEYFQEQIKFHQSIITQMQAAQAEFDRLPF